MATIKDVAETAGVSIATVSNVITGARRVSAKTEKRVMDAIRGHGYQTGDSAKSSSGTSTKTIGFIVTSIDSVFFPSVIAGIQKGLQDEGYSLTFFPTNFSEENEKKYVNILLESQVDGIIINSVVSPDDEEYFQFLSRLHARGQRVPVVSLERDLSASGINSVACDNRDSAYLATRYLIDCGCTRIAHITGHSATPWANDRIIGYKKALFDHKLQFNSSFVVNGDYTSISGYMQTQNLILNAVEFDGLFCSNDLMAIGAIKALQERGVNVPQEVKVIGYDNTFVSSLISPSLSTINVPKQRMGEEAARILLQLISQDGADSAVRWMQMVTNIIERQSTNPNCQSNWELYL